MTIPAVSPLIGAAELRDRLDEITVLDVRYRMGGPSGPGEYAAGHVPGAAYVDLDRDLAGPPGAGGRHPLPDPSRFQAAMRSVGVSGTRPVVVYDDWSGRAAARAWWLLRHHGHDDVRVLDGGLASWLRLGASVSRDPAAPEAGDFAAAPGRLPVLRAEDVPAFVERGTLVDARNPERFRGDEEPVDPVAGHIPGAVNVPTGANLRADGTFRTPAELTRLYPAEGPVGVYCGSGVTAAHDLLAMSTTGLEGTLYPGSWSGWVTDPSRGVATGD